MVDIFMIEKFGVGNFMDEEFIVGKLGVEMSGVEMPVNQVFL